MTDLDPAPRRRSERGAAAVEFALVLPILLTIVFGIVQYGWYFYSVQAGSDVARDAARRAAVSDPITCTDFLAAVRSSLAPYQEATPTATVTRTYVNSAGATKSPAAAGDYVRVEIGFQSYDFGLPFVPLPGSGYISVTAESRVESVGLGAPPTACTA